MSAAPFRRRHLHYTPEVPGPALTFFDGVAQWAPGWRELEPPSVPVDTSEAAAQAIKPAAPTIRDAIFAQIAASKDGLTAGELEARTAYSGSTIRPRLRELEGSAPWAKGQLPARIVRTSAKRLGMRVYRAC